MKVGLQLYALRAVAAKDLKQALKIASEIGYDGVEFAGFFGHSASEVKEWLKEYQLEALGAHIPENEIFEQPEETIAFHKEIENSRIICPWSDLKTAADAKALAKRFNLLTEKYNKAGMRLFYHNHAHEFAKEEGKYLIDILAESAPDISLEFDVYWVYRGKESPVDYLKKYADRVEIFHAKDGNMEVGTIAGTGEVPLEEVFRTAKELSMEWAVVESEACEEAEDQIDAVKKDFATIKRLAGKAVSL